MTEAVLFDLDGTLLPLDMDAFMPRYLGHLKRWFGAALPGVEVVGPLLQSVPVIFQNDGRRTLAEVFWEDFHARFPEEVRARIAPLSDDYYARSFPELGASVAPDPSATPAVRACRARGMKVVLATAPVFPNAAILERMRWAGLDAAMFDRVTTWDWMRFSKPNPAYYTQVADALGVAPAECLMVGNDIEMDLKPAAAAGMRTWWVANSFQVAAADGFIADHTGPLPAVPATP
jgi:HAD superfamily hydrolase (TIGR01509 family)